MSSVTCTRELYDVLEKFQIPILEYDYARYGRGRVGRPVDHVIGDMLRAWRKCFDLKKGRLLIDALSFIRGSETDASRRYFTPEQLLAYEAILCEQERLERAAEADALPPGEEALDEFLDGFKIIGGDAL